MNIIDRIPVGRKNSITRKRLAIELGITDRKVRDYINEARKQTVILNFQDGRGYFRPAEDEANLVKRWKLQEESRLKKHALALRAAREYLKNEE